MAHLLETHTVNFLDLIGNGKIYRVPPFQRDYAWSEENWEDLWSDILAIQADADSRHYMGAIVLQGLNDREFTIIDGQQRLATLSLLVIAVLRRLSARAAAGHDPAENQRRIEILRQTFLGYTDPGTLTTRSKLFLNRVNDPFYQDFLLQLIDPPANQRRNPSNKLLVEGLAFFESRLKTLAQDGAALASLLTDGVARRLLFIQITVEDEFDAFTVFETLNARGVELSSTDLLKNYLFSLVPAEEDALRLGRAWHRVLNTVGADKFPDFLRHHLQMFRRKVRKEALFKAVRSDVRDGAAAFQLLTDLDRSADLYVALADPLDERWRDSRERQVHLRELALFRVRQAMPLLMAAYDRFEYADFTRLLKLIATLTFRYTIISRLNPVDMEAVYNEAALQVAAGTVTTPRQVFEVLRPLYVADEKFRSDFAYTSIETTKQKKKLARYILYRLEDQSGDVERDFDVDPGTIEHILPEQPAPTWEGEWPIDRHEAYVYRLGNLTLLEASINRDLGQADFATKRTAYARSQYGLTRSIEAREWTAEAVTARQSALAELAVRVWRSDFA